MSEQLNGNRLNYELPSGAAQRRVRRTLAEQLGLSLVAWGVGAYTGPKQQPPVEESAVGDTVSVTFGSLDGEPQAIPDPVEVPKAEKPTEVVEIVIAGLTESPEQL